MVLINKLKNFYTSEFVINVSTLMSGTVISQIIPFLVAPIISRLYYPEDYALVAAYNSITVLLTIVATGMYSSALMIDKTDQEAINTASAALLVTASITVISFIIFLLFNETIAKLTKNNNINFWLYLIPLTVFFTGGYQTLNMWNNRLKRYKRLATNRVMQTVVSSGATLLFGLLSYHSTGLMVSLLLGQMFSFILLFYQTFYDDRHLYKEISLEKIKSSFVKHCDFPKYNMPQGFLDGFRESSIVWIISNFFNQNFLGYFSFTMNYLNKPIQIFSDAIGQVFYEKGSKIINEGKELKGFIQKLIKILTIISLPFIIIILFFGKEIFIVIFGVNWFISGQFATYLVLFIAFKIIFSPISSLHLILKKQKAGFYFSSLRNIGAPIIALIVVTFTTDIKIFLLIVFSFFNPLISVIAYRYFLKYA